MRNYTFLAAIRLSGGKNAHYNITVEAQSPTEAIVDAKQQVETILRELEETADALEVFTMTGSYRA